MSLEPSGNTPPLVANQFFSGAECCLEESANQRDQTDTLPASFRLQRHHDSDWHPNMQDLDQLAGADLGQSARPTGLLVVCPTESAGLRFTAAPPAVAVCRAFHRAKSAMMAGADASNPTTSSMPPSAGSAIVNPLETMPTTMSFAAIPIFSR
jgi:hypothetical protein